MEKIYTSLACPFCDAQGRNIESRHVDTYESDKQKETDIMTIKRVYECHCKKCNRDYKVDYGHAILIRYKPFVYGVNDDIKLYVDYESQFDMSYKIAEVDGIPMILVEYDDYPLIIEGKEKKEFIDSHEKAKEYTYNAWMNRYR